MKTPAPYSPLLLPLLSLLTSLTPHTAQAQVYLSHQRIDYFIRPSIILFECVETPNSNNKATFWRTLDDNTEQVANTTDSIVFNATPEVEGLYSCSYDGVFSPPIEVVAYPLQNSTVKTTRSFTAPLGSEVTLPCVYMPGVLRERYTIKWFKGLTQINTSDPRFVVNSNFSLSISDVNALDVGTAYYCMVEVENKFPSFKSYRRTGPSMELVVTDSLAITQPPTTIIARPGTQTQPAKFTCRAFGLPQPSLMWLHQGRSVTGLSAPDVAVDESGVTVSSELEFGSLRESQSGVVECVVLQSVGEEEMVIRSSVASLVVLPSSFQPALLPTGSGVELSITLPSLLPVSFSLVVYYYSPDGSQIQKSELVDPVFSNTRSIEYVIGKEHLPPSRSFFMRVAVKVDEEEGDASASSNTITTSDASQSSTTPGTESCDCSEDDSTVQTILVIFIVFLIVLLSGSLGVAIWGVVLMVKRNRLKSADSRVSFDDADSIDSKRSRSYSRSRSRSSSRSRSRSPTHSGSRSRSTSRSTSVSNRSHNLSMYDSKSALSDREDPEGRRDDEYAVMSSPRSRSDSNTRLTERLNSCTALPLPTVPFGYDRHSERANSVSAATGKPNGEDKENEYEELVTYKKERGKDREKTHPEPLQPVDCNSDATSAV